MDILAQLVNVAKKADLKLVSSNLELESESVFRSESESGSESESPTFSRLCSTETKRDDACRQLIVNRFCCRFRIMNSYHTKSSFLRRPRMANGHC